MRIHVNHYCLNMIPCKDFCVTHYTSAVMIERLSLHTVAFCEGSLEYTPEFTAVSHQYWQDVFCMPCFWCSSKGGGVVLQEQASRQARCARNTWRYLKFENLLAHWVVLSQNSIMHSEVWSNCSYSTDCLAGSHGSVSSQTISHFLNPLTTPGLPAHMILQYQPTASGTVKSIQNTSAKLVA